MIAPRPFYSPDIAAEFGRRSGQGLPLPMPPSSIPDHQSDGIDGLHRRPSPSPEADGNHTIGQTRRRIAVACQRCRKRKIKCSGDLGNGKGCMNCRGGGGASPSSCTFLRVNSRECETYLSERAVQAPGRYNPYPPGQSMAAPNPEQAQSNNVASNAGINPPRGYDFYNGLYGQGLTRATYPAYTANYHPLFSNQAPAFMLPNNNNNNNDHVLSTNSLFGPPASPRNWDAFSNAGRSQNGPYPDHNPSGPMSLPTANFTGSNMPFAPNGGDITSPLSSNGNYETSMTSMDRTLPNPRAGRSQQPTLIMAGANPLDGLMTSNVGYRSSVPWARSEVMSGSGPGSAGASIEAAGMPADAGRSETAHKVEDDPTCTDDARTLSQGSTPSPEHHPMTQAYGYSGEVVVGQRSTRGSMSPATLSNGQEYTRPTPMPAPTPLPYRTAPQQDSPEYQSRIAHRTSIASLSGSTSY